MNPVSDQAPSKNLDGSSHNQAAANLSQSVGQTEKDHFARVEAESKERQVRAPWLREGADTPPAARNHNAGAMVKGKLLTTPSRMLKLILPLTTRDANKDRKEVEPLALLVHPQQPLSYLERLIQSELPTFRDEKDKERPPNIIFRAQDATEEDIGSGKPAVDEEKDREAGEEGMEEDNYKLENAEETRFGDKKERTGKISSSASEESEEEHAELPAHRHASDKESHRATAPLVQDPSHPNFVRWSPSTEIGDFIRDAARGKEFAVDIEGAGEPIYVGVPSFEDRTYYLRMRLRKTAKGIKEMAGVKRECDELAQRGAKRVAQGGFGGLIGWWGEFPGSQIRMGEAIFEKWVVADFCCAAGVVYYLTFKTDLGWDVMEPVTYLVGLSGLIGGYMWFLYHNREVSYKSAMNFTVSRRQSQLYEAKGFELARWEGLVEEGNRLRREVKMVAEEYDVEWDETKDEGYEDVREELRKARKRNGEKDEKKKDEDEDED
ncbi:hypothetical protein LTR62_000069 [Meristemomyces frigidus]|uniref:Calcium uniporter protein n=1 Tax=Meristemomyces frigidus TaxID=1508187 RepID=A0AAN7TJ20_9PEZI|nr:hypothetical protein LTR62_000069 [Meristemomyces frigidus]